GEASQSSRQTPITQVTNNSKKAVAQRAFAAGINSSPRMVAQRQQIETYQKPEQPNNTGLPVQLKTGIEQLSGLSMDDVRVHYNSQKPAQLQALAYTQGTDIHVAPGQSQHLSHEAWHVVQQKLGRVAPTTQMKGVSVNDDKELEREADVMGDSALHLQAKLHNTKSDLNDHVVQQNNNNKPQAVLFESPRFLNVIQRHYVVTGEKKITVRKICTMRNHWYQAALDVIEGMINERLGSKKTANLLDLYKKYDPLSKQIPTVHPTTNQAINPDDHVPPSEFTVFFDEKLPMNLAKDIKKAAKEDGITITTKDVKKNMAVAFIRKANADPTSWTTIKSHIQDQSGEHFLSTQTPVNEEFHPTYAANTGVAGKQYGKTGITSMNERIPAKRRTPEESQRTANLWYSELHKSDSQAARGEKLFSAFRSGGFSAYNEKKKHQAEANQQRAHGVIEAMALQMLKDKELEGEDVTKYFSWQVLPITMAAIDLLSDTSIKGDAAMVSDHHEALRALNGRKFKYAIKWLDSNGGLQDKTVEVSLTILDFNVAVNQASTFVMKSTQQETNAEALNLLGEIKDKTLRMNQEKIQMLEGPIKIIQGDARKAHDQGPQLNQINLDLMNNYQSQIKQIEIRQQQIIKLWEEISNNKGGDKGGYRAPALIANLAYMLGLMVHFNCKSGKDRTGLMDIESKLMARELSERRGIQMGGIPSKDLTTAEKQYRHQQMLWENGSLQILERNTRGQSLKVADIYWAPGSSDQELMERLGGKQILEDLKGLADYTLLVDKMLGLA
ncbi:MAG: inositol phosphate phosphatase SopB, partial [Methylobacter sp.]